MYTTTYIPRGKSHLYTGTATVQANDELPSGLLAALMDKASTQIEAGDYVSHSDVEKMVAAW